MASITSAGLGSGLDIESIIKSLMAVEQQPITQIQAQEAKQTTRLSAWGQVKSVLSSLQTAAKGLDALSDFKSFSTSIGDSTVASATASSTAVAGSYSIEVTQLASAQKIKSAGYASATSTVTSNTLPATLTLAVGTTSGGSFTASTTKTITINSDNNTLTGVRDAINAAKAGVTASLVNDGSGTPYRLVLTSDNTGTTSTFTSRA